MKVILPGSYDPVTLGHLEIIKRAASLYSEVYAVVFINVEKKYFFSAEDRFEMLRLATEELTNVRVDFSDGLVIDYMKEKGIGKIIKGYRNETDYEYEMLQADYNRKYGGFETELWLADAQMQSISSTKAREMITSGEALEKILPKKVISYINSH
jgi:pantetheine-phosphate adenylyltransferase